MPGPETVIPLMRECVIFMSVCAKLFTSYAEVEKEELPVSPLSFAHWFVGLILHFVLKQQGWSMSNLASDLMRVRAHIPTVCVVPFTQGTQAFTSHVGFSLIHPGFLVALSLDAQGPRTERSNNGPVIAIRYRYGMFHVDISPYT
ncbi:hypothetical protein CBL_04317 [Carabus blaptoides fortunei]